MEWASRVVNMATRASNNNTVINMFLLGSFVALSIRSLSQQKDIASLEAEKESLVKANKAMKKMIWDWKQQLLAEASTESSTVPLAKIKAIYGEALTLPTGKSTYISHLVDELSYNYLYLLHREGKMLENIFLFLFLYLSVSPSVLQFVKEL